METFKKARPPESTVVATGKSIMSESPKLRTDAAQMANPVSADGALEVALEQIRDALRGLRFGVVSVIVQDGVVVQLEKTEKRRLR